MPSKVNFNSVGCLLNPQDSKSIAKGSISVTFSRQRECYAIPLISSAATQKKFQSIISANPQAIAFLWRNGVPEAVQRQQSISETQQITREIARERLGVTTFHLRVIYIQRNQDLSRGMQTVVGPQFGALQSEATAFRFLSPSSAPAVPSQK